MYRKVELSPTFASPSSSFSMYLGNDLDVWVTLRDANSANIDLTGYSIDWCLKQSSIVLRKKSATSPYAITIQNQTEYPGVVSFTIAATDTVPLVGTPFASGDYTQEMAIYDGSGKKTTVMTGTVTILGVSI